ncbi:MAG TPA: hypothetical protein VG860_12530 [Terriglobia bacterium]|jgi:ABC-type amino acid transport system permease subunit|nr:hypothetical protein [Terriglobia bacterium]
MGQGDPPSGVDFVYDAGLKKIGEQLKSVESLDTKTGVLIGFLGAVIVGLLAAVFAADPAKIHPLVAGRFFDFILGAIILMLAIDLYFALQAFRMRKLYTGVHFQDLVEWVNEGVVETKKAFLPTLIETVELNQSQLTVKQRNAVRAVWCVFFTFLAILLAVAAIGAEILRGGR